MHLNSYLGGLPRKGFLLIFIHLGLLLASFALVLHGHITHGNPIKQSHHTSQLSAFTNYVYSAQPHEEEHLAVLDSGSVSCVVDNCANCHIWNDKTLFDEDF